MKTSTYSHVQEKLLLELSMSIQRVENRALRHMIQQQVRALRRSHEEEIKKLNSDMFYAETGHTPPLMESEG